MTRLREDAMALYTPPFRFVHGYIYDSKNHMVADQGGCDERDTSKDMMVAQIRGWGRIGYMPNAESLQDEAGQILVDALNAYYRVLHRAPDGTLTNGDGTRNLLGVDEQQGED